MFEGSGVSEPPKFTGEDAQRGKVSELLAGEATKSENIGPVQERAGQSTGGRSWETRASPYQFLLLFSLSHREGISLIT